MERVAFVRREATGLLERALLRRVRSRPRLHAQQRRAICGLAAQVHLGAAARSRAQVFQPASAATVRHLRQLVGSSARARRWRSVQERYQWAHLRRPRGGVVVRSATKSCDPQEKTSAIVTPVAEASTPWTNARTRSDRGNRGRRTPPAAAR